MSHKRDTYRQIAETFGCEVTEEVVSLREENKRLWGELATANTRAEAEKQNRIGLTALASKLLTARGRLLLARDAEIEELRGELSGKARELDALKKSLCQWCRNEFCDF